MSAIIIHEPRLSKKGVQLDNIRSAVPEMFDNYPVPSRRTFAWKDQKSLHYLDTQAFLKAAKVEVVDNFGAIPLSGLVSEPGTLMWEHDGKC